MAENVLRECAVCEKVFDRAALGPLEAGDWVRRWDTRVKTCAPGVAGRGLVGGRAVLGAFPVWKACKLEKIVLACASCGGAVAPAPPPPTWKAANAAWAAWKTLPGGAEWGRLAPRRFRR